MIRSRAVKASRSVGAPSSGGSTKQYRSARAIPTTLRRKGPSKINWKIIKAIMLLFAVIAIVTSWGSWNDITHDNVGATTPTDGLIKDGSNPISGGSIPNDNVGEIPIDGSKVGSSLISGGSVSADANVNVNAIDTIKQSVAEKRSLGRGVAGLPMEKTPALIGASRGHIQCDIDVDELVYWNDPQGTRDNDFVSPFIAKNENTKPKYLTFEPDRGGWNNIRMNLENVFILAAATGRILVLPPAVPVYLLHHDKTEKHKGFADFFNLKTKEFQDRVKIISMEEFLELEGGEDGQFPILEENREDVLASSKECDKRAKSKIACDHIWDYLESKAFVPHFNSTTCLVFDEDMFEHGSISSDVEERAKEFCGEKRVPFYITESIQEEPMIHLRNKKGWRIMCHYYGYMYFTNSAIFNYYKRFVRDFMHYHDEIYCAAGKIVLALQEEGKKRGFTLDAEGGGGFASMHVRRGDLQYKKVKISGEEWYNNLKDTWQENEIVYIATDERNKTFFDPIKEHNDIKFLDDYWDYAGLSDLDPNYMGMIDTIVASRGRTFAGTFFSTFSGYINRMRGYHGMSMKDSFYGFLEKKDVTHTWRDYYDGCTFSQEWPNGWVGIDGDEEPSHDQF